MKRTVTVATLLLLLVSIRELAANQHHKNWLKFLKGQWTYEWTSEDGGFDERGEISYTLAAGGNVLVGRVTTENGDQELETWGWEPDTATFALKGHSSNGGYWLIEYTDVGADTMTGKTRGRLPEGETWEGAATLKKEENGLDLGPVFAAGTQRPGRLLSTGFSQKARTSRHAIRSRGWVRSHGRVPSVSSPPVVRKSRGVADC